MDKCNGANNSTGSTIVQEIQKLGEYSSSVNKIVQEVQLFRKYSRTRNTKFRKYNSSGSAIVQEILGSAIVQEI